MTTEMDTFEKYWHCYQQSKRKKNELQWNNGINLCSSTNSFQNKLIKYFKRNFLYTRLKNNKIASNVSTDSDHVFQVNISHIGGAENHLLDHIFFSSTKMLSMLKILGVVLCFWSILHLTCILRRINVTAPRFT